MESSIDDQIAALPEDQRVMVTYREAADILEVTYSHACELARLGKIKRLGRNANKVHFVDTRSVLEYGRNRQKSGMIVREIVGDDGEDDQE
jgi:hypothetical protein